MDTLTFFVNLTVFFSVLVCYFFLVWTMTISVSLLYYLLHSKLARMKVFANLL